MPKQRTRDEATETGLIGAAVALLTIGAQQIPNDAAAGGGLVVAGLITLFAGIRLRNATVSVSDAEIVGAVSRAAEQVAMVIGRETDRINEQVSDNGGDGS